MKLSIIIPCFNEEDNIAECLRKVPHLDVDYEIIVVDDGSADQTAQRAREAGRPHVKVVRYETNRGKGHALRRGLREASGEWAVICDADYTCPPEDIPGFVAPLLDGRAEFVNGTRFIHPMEQGAMKKLHQWSNRLTAGILSLWIGQRLTDTLCGFKAFRRSQMLDLLQEDSWPDFELLLIAGRKRAKIVEVPVVYKARQKGVSKMVTFRAAFYMPLLLIKQMLRRIE
jgi:glycosyltransferase involved in cell wall biosynthesis